MKLKKKKFKKEKILEKTQEIKKHFKVKRNLKVLNKYVKHIRAKSSGVYYNRNSGLHEQRKKFSSRLYNGFVKARTPKYTDFCGFNFNQILQKGDPTSDPNLRSSLQREFGHDMINLEIDQRNNKNYYLD